MDFDDPYMAEHLEKEKNKFMNSRDKAAEQANSTERSFSNQLILLATVLITINVAALTNETLLSHLHTGEKVLIIVAFGFVTVSTVAGMINYIIIEKAFNKWAEAYQKVVEIIDSRQYDTQDDLARQVDNAQSNVPNYSDKTALYTQVASIIISLAIYFTLLILLLFA